LKTPDFIYGGRRVPHNSGRTTPTTQPPALCLSTRTLISNLSHIIAIHLVLLHGATVFKKHRPNFLRPRRFTLDHDQIWRPPWRYFRQKSAAIWWPHTKRMPDTRCRSIARLPAAHQQ